MKKILCTVCLALICLNCTPVLAAVDEKEVIAMGVGANEEAAKRQAYRNAIQNAIGSMVLSETIVENDTLVQDKILSHSDGYVVKASPVGATRSVEGGLVEVTMRVTVKSDQLKAKLKSENITMAEMDGQSLFAQKKTKEEAKDNAAAILTEKLKNVPSGLLMATAFPDKATQEVKGSMVRLTVPVEVTVDKAAYKTFTRDLFTTLEKLGIKGKTLTMQARDKYDHVGYYPIDFTQAVGIPQFSGYILAICEAFFRETKTGRFKLYELSPENFKAVVAASKKFELTVALKDKEGYAFTEVTSAYTQSAKDVMWKVKGSDLKTTQGRELHTYSAVLGVDSRQREVTHSIAVIAPDVAFERNNIPGAGVTALFVPAGDVVEAHVSFDVSEDELKNITSVQCTVQNIANVQ